MAEWGENLGAGHVTGEYDRKIRKKLGFFGPLKTFNNLMSDDDGSQRTKSVFTPDRGVGTCQM